MSDTLLAVIFILILWPTVIVVAALLNMLISWGFSWSELVIDHLVGVLMGVFFSMGVLGDVRWYDHLLLTLFHGLPGLLKWVGLGFMSSPWVVFAFSASLILGATIVAGLLDLATRALGSTMSVATGFISFLTWLIKAPFTLITPAIGLLIGIVGIIVGAAMGNKVKFNFLGGAMFFEMGFGTSGEFATTFGWVTNVWRGHISNVVDHELYHTRQYIYLRDMLGVFYFTIAGLWGIISSAIVAAVDKTKSFDIEHYFKADGDVGNPIECLAYKRWP
jgi:hypothetical protein